MYIRRKVIKGHTYYYLVEGTRTGKKVKQRVIRYLGKQPRTLAYASGFAPIIRKDAQEVFTRLFYRIGSASVSFDIPSDETAFGYMEPRNKAVHFRMPVTGLTMGHELGHVIDFTLRDRKIFIRSMPEFTGFGDELKRLTDYKMSYRTMASKEWREKLQRWCDDPSISPGLKSRLTRVIDGTEEYFSGYAYTDEEQFANLVSFNLIEPRKARQLAPNATRWLKDLLWKHRDIRAALIEAGAFELGTTHAPAVLDAPKEPA